MQDPRLIIIEGPDCVGKTTLTQNLARILRQEYMRVTVTMHTTYTKALAPGMGDYQVALFKDIAANLQAGYRVILDRSWPSDVVYRPILRPKSEDFSTKIKLLAEQFRPTYLFLERTDVIEAHSENKDAAHPYTKRQFTKIVKAYKALAESMFGDFFLRPYTHILNYKDYSVDQHYILERLYPKASRVEEEARRNEDLVQGRASLEATRPLPSEAELRARDNTKSEMTGEPPVSPFPPADDPVEEAKLKESLERLNKQAAREEAAIKRESRPTGGRGMSWEEGVDPTPEGVEPVETE